MSLKSGIQNYKDRQNMPLLPWSNSDDQDNGSTMKSQSFLFALFAVTAFWAADSQAAQPNYAYSTTVHLSDGKTLSCAVNEPLTAVRATGTALTRRETTEADVLATQRLRLVSGPTSAYPSPYTAPNVACGAVG
ncbi:hypothetical protein [Paraburkholderia aspalathi]|uniref:hypothetical protein n=1 Tax=Paraburkholderia aspalathi TaxID=1324617 RepID=UPI0011602CB2|nr:hypothetical protein [Paraburkholderia aspalathi]